MIKHTCDICVYGATASGILAAISAAKAGRKVFLVEPGRWLGGMVGGGIRITTDCEHPNHVGGLTRELLLRERTFNIWDHDRGQEFLREMWSSLIAKHGIVTIFEHRLQSVDKADTRINSLMLEHAPPDADGVPAVKPKQRDAISIEAKVYIDSSYEGDLLALSGVSHTLGRESRDTYGESLAGVRNFRRFPGIDPWKKKGDPASGLLSLIPEDPPGNEGDASRFIIPFNFRFVRSSFINGSGVPAGAPGETDPEHRELINRVHAAGHLKGPVYNYFRRGLIDGSLPGLQADYAGGDWSARARVWRTLIEHDKLLAEITGIRLPLHPEMFPDTHGWPHQLYIRMARRMKGVYTITQADLAHQTQVDDPIGLGYYIVDIYPCRLVVMEDGTLATEGETWELVSPGPYPLSYRALVPKPEECDNLLVSVCISASHVACASIRMEPTYMLMGESAGIAAAQAVSEASRVQDIDMQTLRGSLREAGQILEWDGEGYGAHWFNRPFEAWWQKHPEEYK